jgi:hypothetical protein
VVFTIDHHFKHGDFFELKSKIIFGFLLQKWANETTENDERSMKTKGTHLARRQAV